MFIFAHAFLGALIGLGFWSLTGDRRTLPLGIVSAVLPDLLDKPLALLFPDLFGAGRTLGHTLGFFGCAMILGFVIWHYRHTLLGIACACAILSHQVLDEMWNTPSVWCYPLFGPFPAHIPSDYLMISFWHEISSLSEWVFAFSLLVIIAIRYPGIAGKYPVFTGGRVIPVVRGSVCPLLCITGVALILPATGLIAPTWFALTYAPSTGVMAGILAMGGAAILLPLAGSSVDPGDLRETSS